MNRLLLAAALLCCAALARAQAVPAPAYQLAPSDWYKIGAPFGSRDQWQLGFDKSPTAGSCVMYAVRARFLMAGPCRDVLLLAKDKVPAFHLGGAALYSASHTPGYLARVGFTVGPAARAALQYTADRIPYVEAAANWQAPKALAYLGKITTFDYSAGAVGGQLDHGPSVKVDLPIPDLLSVLPGF